jgi:hypothetical protein
VRAYLRHLPGTSPLERRAMQNYRQLIEEAADFSAQAAHEQNSAVAAIYHRQHADTLLTAQFHLVCAGSEDEEVMR